MIGLSVIICTYNPDINIFKQILLALQNQTLSKEYWELIIVDNNSSTDTSQIKNIDWHTNFHFLIEPRQGLANARLAGFNKCKPGSLIVFVDDDNILNESYLEKCLKFNSKEPRVGCFGGKSLPVYETVPPKWFDQLNITLGCQDFGDEQYISSYSNPQYILTAYPDKAPIGTGMAITYNAFLSYTQQLNNERLKLGRKGNDLTSAEDNDIILNVIENGFEIAYVPALVLKHIIPKKRYGLAYLKSMAYKSNISWIKVLELHHINPHYKISKWTVLPRQIRAWFKLAAWKNEVNNIKWHGACGVFKGLSEI